MAQEPASDEMAKQLRASWFRYVDTIEPIRPALYRYCRRITRDVWEAEDLLQETLLRGFGAIGRGDLYGDWSRVANTRAYLFRIATNFWIDQLRRGEVQAQPVEIFAPSPAPEVSVATHEAAARLLAHTTPQERAAIILKDVFDFTLEDIAVMLSSTVGTIKSALHRGREKLEESRKMNPSSSRAPSKELIDRVVAAFNARDVKAMTDLLLENVTLDVPGVGGERGKNMIWVGASLAHELFVSEALRYRGEWIVITWDCQGTNKVLVGVNRFEEENGLIARIREYAYCPDAIAEIAAELGAKAVPFGYHQDSATLSRMIESSNLPWRKLA